MSVQKNNKDLHVLSLFSGCGGMDLGFEGGFEVLKSSVNFSIHPDWQQQQNNYSDNSDFVILPQTRFTTVFANDIRPDAKAAWTNFFGTLGIPAETYHLGSIVDLVKQQKEDLSACIFPKNIDVVTGGFPCQDFSIAGKRRGFDSKRSHLGGTLDDDTPSIESRGQLYMWMRDVITLVEPKVFIAENVKGLTNLGDVKAIIEHDFEDACDGGYIVIPARVLHAADFGVPQNRERVIFFGFRKSALTDDALVALTQKQIPSDYDPYPLPTHKYTALVNDDRALPFVTIKQCFTGLLEPENSKEKDQQKFSHAKYMGKHCQGQNEINLEGIGPTIRSEHHGNIEFRRLSQEHCGKHVDELEDGLKERRLTIRECARIQTFPDNYHFVIPAINGNKSVSASDAYKIIGNAVPPLLAYNIAMRLQDNWELYFGTKA